MENAKELNLNHINCARCEKLAEKFYHNDDGRWWRCIDHSFNIDEIKEISKEEFLLLKLLES